MAEPSISKDNLEWASSDISDPVSGQDNKIIPSSTKMTNGWYYREKPPNNWFNYWMNLVWQWIKHIVDDVMKGTYTFTGVKTFKDNEFTEAPDFVPLNVVAQGNTITIAGSYSNLTVLSETRVAVANSGDSTLSTYEWDGTDWSLVGNQLTITGLTAPYVSALASTTVVVFDANAGNLSTYEWDGTDWSLVGNQLSISIFARAAIASLTSNRIAISTGSATNTLRTYEWDGTDWSLVGNQLSISGVTSGGGIAGLSSSRVAWIDSVNKDLRTYEWDGTDWSLVGNELNIPGYSGFALCSFSDDIIGLTDNTIGNINFYKFKGNSWYQTGESTTAPSGGGIPSIGALSKNNMVYLIYNDNNLRRYRLQYVLNENNGQTPFQQF